jgi:hypothetical protein
MNTINITRNGIISVDIREIPVETATGDPFKRSSIAWVKTKDGGDYDILFDEKGEPVLDIHLVNRVGEYFSKKFQPVIFDGRPAFAQVNGF